MAQGEVEEDYLYWQQPRARLLLTADSSPASPPTAASNSEMDRAGDVCKFAYANLCTSYSSPSLCLFLFKKRIDFFPAAAKKKSSCVPSPCHLFVNAARGIKHKKRMGWRHRCHQWRLPPTAAGHLIFSQQKIFQGQ
jgi:hypothetical protein